MSGIGAAARVEVEEASGGIVYIRNTANVSHPVLCTLGEWFAFIEGVKAGRFDQIGKSAPAGETAETVTAA